MSLHELTAHEVGYLAGLIDADGTITFQRRSPRKGAGIEYMPLPMVLVVNSNFPLIERVKEMVGAGCAYLTKAGPPRPDQRPDNWRPVHRFQVTGAPAIKLCRAIFPHLIIKRAQAEIIINHPIRGDGYERCASAAQKADAMRGLARIRELNMRGVQVSAHV